MGGGNRDHGPIQVSNYNFNFTKYPFQVDIH